MTKSKKEKKINLILLIIVLLILSIVIYMVYLIKTNENTSTYFNLSTIQNSTWVNLEEDISFSTDGSTAFFDVLGDRILNGVRIEFEPTTGEISYMENGEKIRNAIYIKDIKEDSLTLWYNNVEYILTKKSS